MAPPTGAFVMRDAVLTIDTVQYANQVTMARVTAEQPTQTIRTLVPDGIVQDVDTAVYTLNLSGIQDYTAAVGLARFLFDNDGQDIAVVLEPKAGGVSWSMTCKAKSPEIGGEQGAWAIMDSLTLPVIGRPVPTDPV